MLSGFSVSQIASIASNAQSVFAIMKFIFNKDDKLDDHDRAILNRLQTLYKEVGEMKADEPLGVFSYTPEYQPRIVPDEGSLDPLNYEARYGSNELTSHARACVGLLCQYQTDRRERIRLRRGKIWDARGLVCFFIKNLVTEFTRSDLNDYATAEAIHSLLTFIEGIRDGEFFDTLIAAEGLQRCLLDIRAHVREMKCVTEKYRTMLSAREHAQSLIGLMQMIFYDGVDVALRIPSKKTVSMHLNAVTLCEIEEKEGEELTPLQQGLKLLCQSYETHQTTSDVDIHKPRLFEKRGKVWRPTATTSFPMLESTLVVEESKAPGEEWVELFLKNDRESYDRYMQFLALLEQLGENTQYIILSHNLAGETGNWGVYYQLGTPINTLCDIVTNITKTLKNVFEQLNNYLQDILNQNALKNVTRDAWYANINFVFNKKEHFLKYIDEVQKICSKIKSQYRIHRESSEERLQKEIILPMMLLINGVRRSWQHLHEASLVKETKSVAPAKKIAPHGIVFCIQHTSDAVASASDAPAPIIHVDMESFIDEAPRILNVALSKQKLQLATVEEELKVQEERSVKLDALEALSDDIVRIKQSRADRERVEKEKAEQEEAKEKEQEQAEIAMLKTQSSNALLKLIAEFKELKVDDPASIRASRAAKLLYKTHGSHFWISKHDKGFVWLKALAHNHTLTSLDLRACGLSPEGAKVLASMLAANHTLTSLSLWHNLLGPEGAKVLAPALVANNTLTSLDLCINKLGPEGAKVLAPVLAVNTTLTSLSFWHNDLGPEGAKVLVSMLAANNTLTSLDLGSNVLGPEGAKVLVPALKANHALTSLDLSINDLGLEGAIVLASMLGANHTLTKINLANNGITDGFFSGALGGKALKFIEDVLARNRAKAEREAKETASAAAKRTLTKPEAAAIPPTPVAEAKTPAVATAVAGGANILTPASSSFFLPSAKTPASPKLAGASAARVTTPLSLGRVI